MNEEDMNDRKKNQKLKINMIDQPKTEEEKKEFDEFMKRVLEMRKEHKIKSTTHNIRFVTEKEYIEYHIKKYEELEEYEKCGELVLKLKSLPHSDFTSKMIIERKI